MNFVLGDYMKNFIQWGNINLVRGRGGAYWGIFSDIGLNKFSANGGLLLSSEYLS